MVAMELVTDREGKQPAADAAKALTGRCLEKGLLVLASGTYGNVVRILSPLVITDDQLEHGLQILEEGLSEVSQ